MPQVSKMIQFSFFEPNFLYDYKQVTQIDLKSIKFANLNKSMESQSEQWSLINKYLTINKR